MKTIVVLVLLIIVVGVVWIFLDSGKTTAVVKRKPTVSLEKPVIGPLKEWLAKPDLIEWFRDHENDSSFNLLFSRLYTVEDVNLAIQHKARLLAVIDNPQVKSSRKAELATALLLALRRNDAFHVTKDQLSLDERLRLLGALYNATYPHNYDEAIYRLYMTTRRFYADRGAVQIADALRDHGWQVKQDDVEFVLQLPPPKAEPKPDAGRRSIRAAHAERGRPLTRHRCRWPWLASRCGTKWMYEPSRQTS